MRELCDWPGVEAMPVLEHVVGHSDNKVHRVLALRGCVRLLRTAGSTVSGDQAAQYVQATVKTAQQALADEVTRRDAALAIISMAPVIAGFNPAAARAALDEVSKHSKDADMTAKVQAFVQCIDGFGDYVMNWQVSPAYGGKPCTHLFHQVFDPEKKGAGVAWSLMPVGTNPQQPWLINIWGIHLTGVPPICCVSWVLAHGCSKPSRHRLSAGSARHFGASDKTACPGAWMSAG